MCNCRLYHLSIIAGHWGFTLTVLNTSNCRHAEAMFISTHTLNRDDRGVCTLGRWWRWRSHICLVTPPQYVRTLSRAELFKRREGETDRRGERERFRYPPTPCLSCTLLTNYYTLYPHFLPLSLPNFPCAFSSLPSSASIRFSATFPSPLPSLAPARACQKEYD